MVSLAKISENSKIELERALKLLTEIDVEEYMNDSSEVIKEAAYMLKDYDESEIALMRRDAKRKDEYEVNLIKKTAREEGEVKAREEAITTMSKNGFDSETIAKALSLDIIYVNEVLKKQ